MQFSTIDVDNDLRSGENCAADEKFGGWWFNSCADANLNGRYGTVSSYDDLQRFVLIKNGSPKTIYLSQEIISMSNTKVHI
jgi:hypothetical protein